jgi:tRNA 2-thiouridine synthesizing protein A
LQTETTDVADKTLDARNLNCPLPILKAKKAIAEVAVGGTLEVLATDPGSVPDFKAFCEAGGHTLVEQGESAGVYRFLIRRAA